MIEVNHTEYWRSKAGDYEHLYHEQKNICDGYRQIIKDLIEIKNPLTTNVKKILER